jgi:hypothetical protein
MRASSGRLIEEKVLRRSLQSIWKGKEEEG